MPKNWKYIKKLLEKEFLCEKLRGHITYDLTDYEPAPWYQQHFIMKYDDEVLIEARQPERYWVKGHKSRLIHWPERQLIVERLYQKYGLEEYSVPIRLIDKFAESLLEETDKLLSHYDGIFGVSDIIDSIGVYLHTDIEKNLSCGQDDFIKALAILDRRCGKRTLRKFASYNYSGYPDWLRRIFQIRFEAEGIKYTKHYEKNDETS